MGVESREGHLPGCAREAGHSGGCYTLADALRAGVDHRGTTDRVQATIVAGDGLREVLDGLCGEQDRERYDTHDYCLAHGAVVPTGKPCPVTLAAFKAAAYPHLRAEYNSWRASAERRGVWLAEVRKLAEAWQATPDAACCDECQTGVHVRHNCGDELLALIDGFGFE